ncbi:hypothetical protein [Streptomyces sp. NPDC058457]|uniref:hypothetical protein n=1 Tax=Streptomyces sp. NPDC058457 TaxID=3346507 RepID=UPI00364F12C6
MTGHRVERLPVADEEGTLVGFALIAFLSTPGTVLGPGEREFVEERHYFGKGDDHREFRK